MVRDEAISFLKVTGRWDDVDIEFMASADAAEAEHDGTTIVYDIHMVGGGGLGGGAGGGGFG